MKIGLHVTLAVTLGLLLLWALDTCERHMFEQGDTGLLRGGVEQ